MFRLLTVDDVCEALQISRASMWNLVKEGVIPKPNYTLGKRSPRWMEADIQGALESGKEKEGAGNEGL